MWSPSLEESPASARAARPSPRSRNAFIADLVNRWVSDRDTQAFNQIYDLYFTRVAQYVVSIGYDREVAHDAAQEAFFAAVSGLRQLNSASATFSWLCTTAKRKALHLTSTSLRQIPSGISDELDGLLPPLNGGEPRIVESIAISDAIERLPEGARRVLNLIIEDGLTAGEVADVLGISRVTVNGFLKVATSRLALQLPAVAAEVRARADARSKPQARPKPSTTPPMNFDQQLAVLPIRRREVMERYIYRGLRPTQIAADLRITSGCARVHVSLGLTDLAKRLGIDRESLIDQIQAMRAA